MTKPTQKKTPPRLKRIPKSEVPAAIAKMKNGGPRLVAVIRLKGPRDAK